MNSNAKLFTAESVGEPLAIVYGVVRDMDSSTSCDQRGEFQTSCQDLDCPRCVAQQLAVQSLKGTTAVAVLVKDVMQKLPHRVLDDGVVPLTYRAQLYGNFPFTTLDRQHFHDRMSKCFHSL